MYPAGLKILCDGYVMRVLIWERSLDRNGLEALQCKGCGYSILRDGYVIAIPNTWMGGFSLTLALALPNRM
jgi:hypothetical protein